MVGLEQLVLVIVVGGGFSGLDVSKENGECRVQVCFNYCSGDGSIDESGMNESEVV